MKLRIFAICLCLVFLLVSLPAGASGESLFADVSVNYNRASGKVSISGKAPFVLDETEPVRLVVLKPDTDINKLITGEVSIRTCGVYAMETKLSNYNFTFDQFTLSSGLDVGDYIVRISAGGEVYTDLLAVATPQQAIALLNNASSENIGKYISKYNDVYELETGESSLYGSFDTVGTAYVCSKLADKDYVSIEEFKNMFNAYSIIYKVKAGPWGVLENIVVPNASILGLELGDFNGLSESQQDAVFKELTGKLYESNTEFKTAFDTACENASVSNSSQNNGKGNSSNKATGGTISWSDTSSETTQEPDDNEFEVFSDLNDHLWAKESVLELYNKGIVNGKSNGIFAPNDFLTRAEAVKILVSAFGGVDEKAVCDFSDVDRDSWAYPFIATAYEKGIIKGYDNGTAGADNNITREDFCVMIMRAAENTGVVVSSLFGETTFGDSADISLYAREAVKTLQMAGVINGVGENMFLPKANITRAQAAKIAAGLI